MSEKVKCQFCGKEYTEGGIKKHETACSENPSNKVVDETSKLTEENNQLKEQLLAQATMMETLQKQMAAILDNQSKVQSVTTEKEIEEVEEIMEIPPTKRIKLVHMVYGGTTLQGSRTKLRFDDRGQGRTIKFEDLEELRYGEYAKVFEDILVYIKDKDVRKVLDLDQYYEKYQVDKYRFENFIKLDDEEMLTAIKGLSLPLQISFATFFIDCANEGKPGYSDRNKWAVLNKHFNIKINEMLEE